MTRAAKQKDEDDRAEHQHVIGEVEDRALEANRIDMKTHEITDVPVDQAVVAVAQRTCHDQSQGNRQSQTGGRATNE